MAHDELKPKDFVGWGTYFEPEEEEKRRKWISKWKEHVIPKGKNKQPTEVINTHSVTVIPRLYYLSALTSLSEMASCFIQGILE